MKDRSVLTICLVLAITSIVIGTSRVFGNSEWMVFLGLGLFVLTPALRRFTWRSPSEELFGERRPPGQKISKSLIAISSAAIMAVYAAGYDRTGPAADRLAAHAAVRQGQYPDGAYLGWGFCRHGTIQVEVVIRSGRISSADITQCKTRYPCSVIKDTPSRLVRRQITETYDNVTGATQSVDAYYGAVMNALGNAAKRLQ